MEKSKIPDYSVLYKKGLSPAQVTAIKYIGDNITVFSAYNCWIHKGTLKSLMKRGFIQKHEKYYVKLTSKGKECFEIYNSITNA